jgi:hypothetical protein
MESENNSQMATESSQNDNIQESEDTRDYKALYLKEVENSKNQRSMKQKFRSENEKFKAKQEEIRKKEMSVAELNTELTATNKDMAKRIAKYEERDESEKMDLLNKLPDKDREEFSDLPLSKIKVIVARLTQAKPDTLKEIHGAVKPVKMDKPYSQMSDEERRAYYTQLANERFNN